MAHTCSCRTSRRRVGPVPGDRVDTRRELADAVERFDGARDEELGTAVAEVDPGTRFAGVAAVFDLVAGLVGGPVAWDVRATWLEDCPSPRASRPAGFCGRAR